MKELSGLIGGFQLLGRWTSTPAGEVYAARDERSSSSDRTRIYAITFLSERLAPKGNTHFLGETLRGASRFFHEHVAQQHEVFEHEGNVCVISDFVAGETLSHVLRTEVKSLPAVLAVSLSIALARTLQAAHNFRDADPAARMLVHGDVCPSNIVLTYDGRVVLTNFGIALAQSRMHPTRAGLRGHCGYMAPERASCSSTIDGASDIYSLGMTLYEMLAGGPAFRAGSDQELIAQAVMAKVPPLATKVRCTDAIQRIMTDVLQPEPSSRLTGEELAAALTALRSVRKLSYDATGELRSLLERRFEHKVRAWRTLQARWTNKAMPAKPSPRALPATGGGPPRRGPAIVEVPGAAIPAEASSRREVPPAVPRAASFPGASHWPRPGSKPGSMPRPPSRAASLPPALASLPPGPPTLPPPASETPRILPAAALSLDVLAPLEGPNTNDIVAAQSRDLPRAQPVPLSFVRGISICFLLVAALTASTFIWPARWWTTVLAFMSGLGFGQ